MENSVVVEVNAIFDTDGRILPKEVRMLDGRRYPVESIMHITPVQACKDNAGRIGTEYLVRIDGQAVMLIYNKVWWLDVSRTYKY